MLSSSQVKQFVRNGYLILPKLIDLETLAKLRQVTNEQLMMREPPYELEAEVHYPGAPESKGSQGGDTIRRLLHAFERHQVYRACAENPDILIAVQQLLHAKEIYITPNHHNCVMTKLPEFSSQTNWHRDTRYWNFSNKYLINAWAALGDEKAENGGMLILPGSHRWDVSSQALDEAQFLREDYSSNQARFSLAQQVDLHAGDCLLFSAHCFHAAGINATTNPKYSIVFTYHSEKTTSLPETRSSQMKSIKVR